MQTSPQNIVSGFVIGSTGLCLIVFGAQALRSALAGGEAFDWMRAAFHLGFGALLLATVVAVLLE